MKRNPEQGLTLVETMVALVILAIGVMAVARVFPSVSANQLTARMLTTGSNLAREKQEELALCPGRTQPCRTDATPPAPPRMT